VISQESVVLVLAYLQLNKEILFTSFVIWDVPIKANSHRSTELKEFKFDRNTLVFQLIEEDTEKVWSLSFDSLQAFRTTTEECSAEILKQLPTNGGFFKAPESVLLDSLGKNNIHFLNNACHFVICCYDEVLEVIADVNSAKFCKGSSPCDR